MCVCYLPPENSSRGNESQEFLDNMLSQIYVHHHPLISLVICGDFNARLGEKQDYSDSADTVPKRIIVDKTLNRYGHHILDFLNDPCCCILNGRGDPKLDNYTSVSPRGRAVVDYMIVPRDQLSLFSEFQVQTVSDLANEHRLTPSSRMPDHSVLKCALCLTPWSSIRPKLPGHCVTGSVDPAVDQPTQTSRRYKLEGGENIANMFNSPQCVTALTRIIDSFLEIRTRRITLNTLYEELIATIHGEMDSHMEYIDINMSRKSKRRFRVHKPFWNRTLTDMWKCAQDHERSYLSFKQARNKFDKEYRKTERRYFAEQRAHIEELNTNDPKQFWRAINKLGPGKAKKGVVNSVRLDNGDITESPDEILKKWKQDYENLFKGKISDIFDDEFVRNIDSLVSEWDGDNSKLLDYVTDIDQALNLPADDLNAPLSEDETRSALNKAKPNKSPGIDNLPNEIVRSTKLFKILHKLFATCFEYNVIPDMWCKNTISPILKKGKDPLCPLHYRGISIISTVAKVFTNILNTRLTTFLEYNNLMSEEQNGFRKKRSCLDHIFVLCTIIRDRKRQKLPTYACFVDFSQAFDSTKRNLLWFKLVHHGVRGKFYHILRSLYSSIECSVRVPGLGNTDWFSVLCGVRQGDNLSPTLFALYVNDLIQEIKGLNAGIQIDEHNISVLAYADDLVLIANTEQDLQRMLDVTANWCVKWCIRINLEKTRIMHFRPKSKERSQYQFHLHDTTVDYTERYRYLGLDLDEHMDYTHGANILASASSRALGALTTKHFSNKGLPYSTFTKLYHSTVTPIMDYAAAVWGSKTYDKLNSVQLRAQRTFLGVGKFTPSPAVEGDMGWVPIKVRHHVDMIRYWIRVQKYPAYRLPHIVFAWDYEQASRGCQTWNKDIHTLLEQCNMGNLWTTTTTNFLARFKDRRLSDHNQHWIIDVESMPKIRTYKCLKTSYGTEHYLKANMSIPQRSYLAKMRMGTLPLKIETGRYTHTPVDQRICQCGNEVETEEHFLLRCPIYDTHRVLLYDNINAKLNINVHTMSDAELFILLFKEDVVCKL